MDLPPYVPTPEEGLEQQAQVTPHLQPALDNALFETTTYFESKNLQCDVSTFLTLLRAHIKDYLVKQKIPGVKFKDWSLSGIEWQIGDVICRSWKGVGHELPPPGLSAGRIKFLNQQYPLPLEFSEATKLRNFVVLYDIGPSNKITLWLVCPKRYDADDRIAEAWWWIQIPEPAAGMSGTIGPTAVGTPARDLDNIQPKVPQSDKKVG